MMAASDRRHITVLLVDDHAVAADRGHSDGLSEREFEVLRLLVQGVSVKDIAHTLTLNPRTVANHQSATKHKLGVETAIELLRKAAQIGLKFSESGSM